jgi:peptidyl-prolyl cis-trans isomerase A (cyclophilin A)
MQRCSLSMGLFSLLLLVTAPGCGEGDAPTASITEEGGATTAGGASATQSDAAREREARRQADLHPIVEFTTTAGTFKLKLDRAKAEKTVHNFLEYVASGFYQGTVFHQVEKGFVIAGGGYMENMQPKPARVSIRNEAHNGLKNARMTVAMVRSPGSPHSATSQFLINLADNPSLDHVSREMSETGDDEYGYCVFGEVIEGADVIEAIAGAPVKSATVQIKRPGARKPLVAGQVSTQAEPEAAQFDEVTFEALPTRQIVIQSARRVK